ncbi:MAG: hypothetical protein AUH85_05465 [Chloroflexi bacterium 13_1_40CM_4_68_4]|nr:MAG: hypothetical protein AUH85_05465 [Chloroflexi bacterium 13_1_40CM_4_68_4]
MNSRAPLVSVLTPTFNQSEFIGECVSSVIAQSYPHWEQIVIDDSSTDTTEDVVRRCTDRRVHLHRQPHAGILALASTYNRALRESRGDLVAILEGDDFWAPDKLDLLVPKFNDPSVVLAYGRAGIVAGAKVTRTTIPDARFARRFGRTALFNDPPGAAARAMLRVGYPFTFPCAVVIRRAALDAIGGFQAVAGLGAMDYPTFLELTLVGRFAYVDRVVAYWRRHPGSGSWSTHEPAIRSASAFAGSFVQKHSSMLGLSPGEARAVDAAARRRVQRAAFNSGRNLLLQRRWREAQNSFMRAVRSPYPPILLGGLVGYAASVLKIDIEGLMRAVGRTSFGPERTAKR